MKPLSNIAVANKIIPSPNAKSRLPFEVSSAIAVVMTRVICSTVVCVMILRPPRATPRYSSAASDVYKRQAYHEAGHALVSLNYSSSDPIHKATIIPRGRALGMVMRLPERDQISITREKMFANLAVAMGGRIAEEEVFGYEKVTSGASSDIKQATQLARAMVMQYGMSDKLGFLSYGDNEEEVFLGRSVARTQNMSEETQKQVDSEVKVIVDKSYINDGFSFR